MSDKPISVGDLVQVVRPSSCCGATGSLGFIFRVDHINSGDQLCICCGWRGESTDAWFDGSNQAWQLCTLKRIPPLEELKGEHTEEHLITSK